jgi:KipI family sensor histidine kinase inhibitor
MSLTTPDIPTPTLMPLGDSALLVRFGSALTLGANGAAIALARRLDQQAIAGVLEIVPNLISVLLRYDPQSTSYKHIAGELRLLLFGLEATTPAGLSWTVPVAFEGPDLPEVAQALGMSPQDFIAAHNHSNLRVLSTGFAPGFVYCGIHPDELSLPRRSEVRSAVPAGSILFAAGQTAITATAMPTGWHLIGHTEFANFDPNSTPPTRLRAGESIQFVVSS